MTVAAVPSVRAIATAPIVLLPPTSRDGSAVASLLESVNIRYEICDRVNELSRCVNEQSGALILSEEAVLANTGDILDCLRNQPVWSDLPVLLLSHSGRESKSLTAVLAQLGNVTVVERPVRMTTFLSLIHSALRARERQFEVREHLNQLDRIQKQRAQLLESERIARGEAERISRMKDEFLATLSHELRTPLNAILGWAQIMQLNSRDPEDVKRGIEVIERNARAQSQIIEDLLDMSRIISGKVRLDVSPIDLAAVVYAAVDTARPTAEAKGVKLESFIDPLHGVNFSGDANRLQQILWNLISNSIKFTPSGGTVQLHLQRSASQVELLIADSGEGIRADFLPYLFDRFRQADATTTRKHGGLGLGLSIVKQLVELHGGTINAYSDGPGKGSQFRIVLPFKTTRANEPQAMGASRAREAAAAVALSLQDCRERLHGVRILIVDDEADARLLVQRLLEDCDARVSSADSAAAAMAALSADRFDLLISDIGMPGEDGYAFIRRVRALPEEQGGNIPAIALTAYARQDDRTKALSAGFQQHLSKPIDANDLIVAVASVAPAQP